MRIEYISLFASLATNGVHASAACRLRHPRRPISLIYGLHIRYGKSFSFSIYSPGKKSGGDVSPHNKFRLHFTSSKLVMGNSCKFRTPPIGAWNSSRDLGIGVDGGNYLNWEKDEWLQFVVFVVFVEDWTGKTFEWYNLLSILYAIERSQSDLWDRRRAGGNDGAPPTSSVSCSISRK